MESPFNDRLYITMITSTPSTNGGHSSSWTVNLLINIREYLKIQYKRKFQEEFVAVVTVNILEDTLTQSQKQYDLYFLPTHLKFGPQTPHRLSLDLPEGDKLIKKDKHRLSLANTKRKWLKDITTILDISIKI